MKKGGKVVREQILLFSMAWLAGLNGTQKGGQQDLRQVLRWLGGWTIYRWG
jgi:hypothetical protein